MRKKHTFGVRLRKLRLGQELSLDDLAKCIGTTHQAISKWEVSDVMPNSKYIQPLASALGVSCDELLRGEP